MRVIQINSPPRCRGRYVRIGMYAMLLLVICIGRAIAADPENCLSCHRYAGLARVADDGQSVHMYSVDPDYYDRSLGPHARLACSDCHDRDQVGVIPHKPTRAVDCTNRCHLEDTTSLEVTFSHQMLAATLEHSVHTTEVLDECNELLGRPLDDGQSRCLLCHDEPTFRHAGVPWVQHAAPVERCQVCHDEQLPVNQQYMYWHVHARSEPAYTSEHLTRACAFCHSNERIRERFDMPDTSASFLHSFHGKAMLLGSQTTASCIDCHVADLHNAHLVLGKDNPQSPVHADNQADTCRSPACHPTAGKEVTTAAVHLDMATSQGIEYLIGFVFVILIACTFGPSVLLQALELFHMVIGRQDAHHHHHRELADKVMQHPTGRKKLKRFTVHQRVQHWFLFFTFTTLSLTGFPMKFADQTWSQVVIDLFGGLHMARMLHRVAGVLLICGFFYHLTYVIVFALREKKRTGRGWISTVLSLPMLMNVADFKYLFELLGYLLFIRKTRPEGDRFTPKEKFEYFGVFWGTAILGLTGVLMWFNAWTTVYLTGRVLTVANLFHTFEAFLALLHVGVIHMIGVIFSPVVFPLSPAMFNGDTPAEEMAEAHAGMLEKAAHDMTVESEGGLAHE